MAGMEHPPNPAKLFMKSTIFHSIYEKTAALGEVLSKIIKDKLIYEF